MIINESLVCGTIMHGSSSSEAVACHNRVMIELYDCQTEDIKLIHMIENIGAMRREFHPDFLFSPAICCPGVISCCRHTAYNM